MIMELGLNVELPSRPLVILIQFFVTLPDRRNSKTISFFFFYILKKKCAASEL